MYSCKNKFVKQITNYVRCITGEKAFLRVGILVYFAEVASEFLWKAFHFVKNFSGFDFSQSSYNSLQTNIQHVIHLILSTLWKKSDESEILNVARSSSHQGKSIQFTHSQYLGIFSEIARNLSSLPLVHSTLLNHMKKHAFLADSPAQTRLALRWL